MNTFYCTDLQTAAITGIVVETLNQKKIPTRLLTRKLQLFLDFRSVHYFFPFHPISFVFNSLFYTFRPNWWQWLDKIHHHSLLSRHLQRRVGHGLPLLSLRLLAVLRLHLLDHHPLTKFSVRTTVFKINATTEVATVPRLSLSVIVTNVRLIVWVTGTRMNVLEGTFVTVIDSLNAPAKPALSRLKSNLFIFRFMSVCVLTFVWFSISAAGILVEGAVVFPALHHHSGRRTIHA